MAGPAREVFLAGRGLVQTGWSLTHHPLYGNFQPHQQPYRSLLLRRGPGTVPTSAGVDRFVIDELSLNLIERAVSLYDAGRGLDPSGLPGRVLDDCALLDFELLRLPLEQAGWL